MAGCCLRLGFSIRRKVLLLLFILSEGLQKIIWVHANPNLYQYTSAKLISQGFFTPRLKDPNMKARLKKNMIRFPSASATIRQELSRVSREWNFSSVVKMS